MDIHFKLPRDNVHRAVMKQIIEIAYDQESGAATGSPAISAACKWLTCETSEASRGRWTCLRRSSTFTIACRWVQVAFQWAGHHSTSLARTDQHQTVRLTSRGHGPFLFCSTTETFRPRNFTVLSLYISAELCEDIEKAVKLILLA